MKKSQWGEGMKCRELRRTQLEGLGTSMVRGRGLEELSSTKSVQIAVSLSPCCLVFFFPCLHLGDHQPQWLYLTFNHKGLSNPLNGAKALAAPRRSAMLVG